MEDISKDPQKNEFNASKKGVNVTLELVSETDTGAEHCQHDNPTLGQERMADWLADQFEIDQRAMAGLLYPG